MSWAFTQSHWRLCKRDPDNPRIYLPWVQCGGSLHRGVLHPGVPVMWYGHIRDLFPTTESCMGSRMPNVMMLHWAQQKNALVGCDVCCVCVFVVSLL